MHNDDLPLLRDMVGRVVTITSTEGEVIVAKVRFVSHEHRDVTYELICSNQPERYRGTVGPQGPLYVIPIEYISKVEEGNRGGC